MKNEVNKGAAPLLDNRTKNKTKTTAPALYEVVMRNDDYTPMEFVTHLLQTYFYMDRRQAVAVMLEAHVEGSAVCGIFTKDVAESKVVQVIEHARENGHPLSCNMEAT